jgi:NAD(P)-dependent dehydrogenase (short-subunit alcohol dehydrogenase family)
MKNNPFSLRGKNIVITGASSGIGRQCAISCSEMGANIILIARNESRLSETMELLTNGNHYYYSLDLTEYDKIEHVIEDACLKTGKIDGLIHAAGIELTLPLKSLKPNHYQEVYGINVIAGLELAKIVSKKKFLNSGGGSFIFISSIVSIVANGGLTAYCASKGAINAGVRAMAIELARKKIRINSVSPGYIQTEMMRRTEAEMTEQEITALQKDFLLGLGKPEDVANTCIYLLSDASRWVTGTNLIVDGGYSAR